MDLKGVDVEGIKIRLLEDLAHSATITLRVGEIAAGAGLSWVETHLLVVRLTYDGRLVACGHVDAPNGGVEEVSFRKGPGSSASSRDR